MSKPLRIATRASELARWQAEHVATRLRAAHPDLKTELVPLTTRGDTIQDRALSQVGGKGLFTKELERALLADSADIAVHSMKDVPVELPADFMLAAVLERHDPRDAFISTRFASIAELPQGARVGTASLRRQAQIKLRRPDIDIGLLRGNVQTRLGKLEACMFDAIILAAAGLQRLGWEERITAYMSVEESLPAIGQGALGIECLKTSKQTQALCAILNHSPSAICLEAERALNRRLHGGCDVPLAGFAQLDDAGTTLSLRGLVASPDGERVARASASGSAAEPEALGLQVADLLLAEGAGDILAALQ
ncbi:MAG TPA: hydroxymethylbilane synthase [Gammaproteobacteria bacterium]|nr:hydroxymethylbilane synthase [Gammaproteobacteria bacterium]